MRKAVFITVRTDSSRLLNKALLQISGKPTVELVILRAKQVRNADEIIVCTTERPVDDGIAATAERCGIKYFRGNLEDKLDRWLNAAIKFKIDYLVTMDGDDLLCDPELMEMGLNQVEAGGWDFMRAPKGLICGAFTYCMSRRALEKVCSIKGTTDTEMMWVYFEDTGLFRVADLAVEDPVFFDDGIRLTLDYPEDFQFFTKVFEHFESPNNDIPLRRIAGFLKHHPEFTAINAFRQRDFLENQKRKTKLVIKESSLE